MFPPLSPVLSCAHWVFSHENCRLQIQQHLVGGLGASVCSVTGKAGCRPEKTVVVLSDSFALPKLPKAWAHCLLHSLLRTLQCGQRGHFRDCELVN